MIHSSCAITGYKPTQFKFKYDEKDKSCKRIKESLSNQIIFLHEQGINKFYIGGSPGVDIWTGEIILYLSELPEFADLEIALVLPFEGHDKNWDDRSKKRMDYIRRHSRSVTILGSPDWPPVECYRKRSRYMVDQSNCLLAVYDPRGSIRGDAAIMVKFAQRKKSLLLILYPILEKPCLLCEILSVAKYSKQEDKSRMLLSSCLGKKRFF